MRTGSMGVLVLFSCRATAPVAKFFRDGRRCACPTILTGTFLLPKRVNDKQHYRNRDARIGDVKRGPGIGVADVQIKKKKVDHVAVKQAVCQISQNPGKKKR